MLVFIYFLTCHFQYKISRICIDTIVLSYLKIYHIDQPHFLQKCLIFKYFVSKTIRYPSNNQKHLKLEKSTSIKRAHTTPPMIDRPNQTAQPGYPLFMISIIIGSVSSKICIMALDFGPTTNTTTTKLFISAAAKLGDPQRSKGGRRMGSSRGGRENSRWVAIR